MPKYYQQFFLKPAKKSRKLHIPARQGDHDTRTPHSISRPELRRRRPGKINLRHPARQTIKRIGTNEKPLSLSKDMKNGFQFRSKLSGATINARPFHHSSSGQTLPARHAQPAGHVHGHLFGNDHCEWRAPANQHGPFPIHGNAPA